MLGVQIPPGLPSFYYKVIPMAESKSKARTKKIQAASNAEKGDKQPKRKIGKAAQKQGKIGGWIQFFKEVKLELKKVNWPPRREIVSSTTALIVSTLLIGLFLGIVDFILAKGVQPALTGNAGYMTGVTLALFAGILVWVYKVN